MIEPTAIFQRTQIGRYEIYKKAHGLTQSERLVLIMIDGVSSYQEVRSKLPVLTDERFSRALLTLQKKDLLLEVLMPLEGQMAEDLESTVIDRFLQQDPMDPITIIVADPDDRFDNLVDVASVTPPKSVSTARPLAAPSISLQSSGAASNAGTAIADFAELADAVEKEVRARQPERRAQWPGTSSRQHKPDLKPLDPKNKLHEGSNLHWGYWMIGIGIAFIVGFLLAHLTH